LLLTLDNMSRAIDARDDMAHPIPKLGRGCSIAKCKAGSGNALKE
jgi:hypothetical protein